MLPSLNKVLGTNVDYRASDTLGRGDNDVVIFSHLESVKRTGLASFDCGLVEDSFIDSFGNSVIDEFTEDKAV